MVTPFHENPRGLATKLIVLFGICCSSAAMPLTFTGPAVALPAISHTLGGDPVALNWVTNAFMLTFGSTLMACGALADNFGRKRIFVLGLVTFALFSTALAFAPNIFVFDLLRALQGLGAAAAFSGGMASLAQEFEGAARMRAFSIVGASFGVGLAFGPIASGAMIDAFGWPSIFALVVALALIALTLGIAFMHESRNPHAGGLDWAGAVTFTLALTLFTYGVLRAPGSGWSDTTVIGLLVGAALLMSGFYFIERSTPHPMLDLTLFRYPRFVGVQLLAAAPAYAFVVLLVLLPVRFVGVEGMSEIEAGQLMIALSGPLLVLPIAAGLLTRWLAPATVCSGGLLLSAIGLFWLSQTPIGSSPGALILPLFTIGVGISLPWGLMDGLAVSVVPKERAGMATGIFSTTRVAGEGVALAVVSAVLSTLTKSYFHEGSGTNAAAEAAQRLVTGDLIGAHMLLPNSTSMELVRDYSDAFTSLLWLLTAITLITATVVLLFLRGDAEDSAGAEGLRPAIEGSNNA
ncbi:MFS family permease [Phyllobacterium sp. 1468]|uniref:MFS transporter n=1 Tax=Phyllobacterium sp. 1468 TaxID=2817759 RepID=UPI002863A95E|nr:MFS transporter [Phyllobacterium sp. 1468]MDR6632642.1 MFS family permease [Phyllobacterium sp. 1468]